MSLYFVIILLICSNVPHSLFARSCRDEAEIEQYSATYDSLNEGEKKMVKAYMNNIVEEDSLREMLAELTAISPLLGRSAVKVYRKWENTNSKMKPETQVFLDLAIHKLLQIAVKRKDEPHQYVIKELKKEFETLDEKSKQELKDHSCTLYYLLSE